MTDTVQKLMALADDYALWSSESQAEEARKALQDELVKLFTPLTDEQIKQATGAGDEYWATSKIYIKAIFQAAEQAHDITGD